MVRRASCFTRSAMLAALAVGALGCDNEQERGAIRIAGGDPGRGRAAIHAYGCSSCHTIPGVPGADALIGPPLERIGSRQYLGGVLHNTPDNMVRWIQDPTTVDPLTAMPNLRVTDADARDIASYLDTLR